MTASVAIATLTNPISAADIAAVVVTGTTTALNTVTVTATDAAGTSVGPTGATVTTTNWSASLNLATLADGPIAVLAIADDGAGALATDSQASTLAAGIPNYITKAQLRAYMGSDTSNFDATVAAVCTVASRTLEIMCDRTFYAGAAAITMYLWPENRYEVCFDSDIYTTTGFSLSIDDGSGTYPIPWTLGTDFLLQPRNQTSGAISGYPWTSARAVKGRWFPPGLYGLEPVKVVGRPGWAAVPAEIPLACLEIAAKLFKAKDAPDDFVGLDGWGPTRLKAEFPMAAKILSPYMLAPIAVA